ncbi:hypothetical protein GCM10011575_40660 [Microlunatus endophyticus]|uniref:DUF559 domain-containing protein n=1 Tax=Microlunatus endophyticus TaxID=1716077 RepID=A0A917SH24_9ACTN|nr:DUF559 domain-containing protein [Microlunatus endophyticus]GGL78214.1 hypothetical protein GCM10011575_40660 [Microlunatus endophyticus]
MKADIEQLLRDNGGYLRRRDCPDRLRYRLDRLQASGQLVNLLPGFLTTPEGADSWAIRLRIGSSWAGPNSVVTRYSAARLTFWRTCENTTISFTVRNPPRPQSGWPVVNSTVPPELTWLRSGLRMSNPAYTAVELAADDDGPAVIDRALRSRQATLSAMTAALAAMRGRRGNGTRLQILQDSRDQPWSELERLGHRLLRQKRITGWRTNVWVDTRGGGYFADVLFRRARLIVEFDGWEFHSDREAFENDRRRRNELVLAGYTVLNFTWRQVSDDPEWVIDCITRALKR